VNFGDFQILASNFGKSASLPASVGNPVSVAPAAVIAANPPAEPASVEIVDSISGVADGILVSSGGVLPIFSDQLLNVG